MTATQTVDLREGYRIEVTPTVLPHGSYAAQLYTRIQTADGGYRWKKSGPLVVSDEGPEASLTDMANAINMGLLPGVEPQA